MLIKQILKFQIRFKITDARGWTPKFATGLNEMIGIDQKIYE